MFFTEEICRRLEQKLVLENYFHNNQNPKFLQEYYKGFCSFLREAKDLDSKTVLNEFLSSLSTPQKIQEVVSSEHFKENIDNVSYDANSKELVLNNIKVTNVTKRIALVWIIIFYILSQDERLQKVNTPFISKAKEVLRAEFTKRSMLSEININTDLLYETFEKTLDKFPLIGCLCYVAANIILSPNIAFVRALLTTLKNTLKSTEDMFAQYLYYFFLKSQKIFGKSVYTEFLAEEVYNNLFALGVASESLQVLKAKLVSPPTEEKLPKHEENPQKSNEKISS